MKSHARESSDWSKDSALIFRMTGTKRFTGRVMDMALLVQNQGLNGALDAEGSTPAKRGTLNWRTILDYTTQEHIQAVNKMVPNH